MRKQFKDARAALVAGAYECDPRPEFKLSDKCDIVFGGEAVCMTAFPGEAYSDNGGRNYAPAELELLPRFRLPHYYEALREALAACPTEVVALSAYPRSDAQVVKALVHAAAIDRAAAGYLPVAKARAENLARKQDAAEAARLRREEFDFLASGKLTTEVLGLFRSGKLDRNAELEGLHGIAAELDNLSPGRAPGGSDA